MITVHAAVSPLRRRFGVWLTWVSLTLVALAMGGMLYQVGGPLASGLFLIRPTGILVAAAAFFALGAILTRQGLPPGWWWPLPFLGWLAVQQFFLTPTPWDGAGKLALAVQAYFLYIFAARFGRFSRPRHALLILLGGLALAALGATFVQVFVSPGWHPIPGWERPEPSAGRAAGFFVNPNSLAGFFLLLFPLAVAVALLPRWQLPIRVVTAAFAATFALAILLTVSRAGWIVLGAQLLILPFLLRPRVKDKINLLCFTVLGTAAALMLLFFASPLVRERLQAAADEGGEAQRPVIWAATAAMWQDAPVLGQGLGSFSTQVEAFRGPIPHFSARSAHQDHLEILAETGLVGGLLWVGLLGVFFVTAARKWHETPWEKVDPDAAYREANLPRHARRRARRSRSKRMQRVPQNKIILTGGIVGLLGFVVHLNFDFHLQIGALAWLAALLAGLTLAATVPTTPGPTASRHLWGSGHAAVLSGLVIVVSLWVLPQWQARGLWFKANERLAHLVATDLDVVFDEPAHLSRIQIESTLATRLAPGFAPAYLLHAMATLQEVRVQRRSRADIGQQALALLDQARSRGGGGWEEPWLRAQALMQLDRPATEVEAALAEARAAGPARPEIYLTMAQAAVFYDEDVSTARTHVLRAIELDPGYEEAKALEMRLRR